MQLQEVCRRVLSVCETLTRRDLGPRSLATLRFTFCPPPFSIQAARWCRGTHPTTHNSRIKIQKKKQMRGCAKSKVVGNKRRPCRGRPRRAIAVHVLDIATREPGRRAVHRGSRLICISGLVSVFCTKRILHMDMCNTVPQPSQCCPRKGPPRASPHHGACIPSPPYGSQHTIWVPHPSFHVQYLVQLAERVFHCRDASPAKF